MICGTAQAIDFSAVRMQQGIFGVAMILYKLS
jgi:hypothetical protein